MKQYQKHILIAEKLASSGFSGYQLALSNMDALIRSARSNKAKVYLAEKKALLTFPAPTSFNL